MRSAVERSAERLRGECQTLESAARLFALPEVEQKASRAAQALASEPQSQAVGKEVRERVAGMTHAIVAKYRAAAGLPVEEGL